MCEVRWHNLGYPSTRKPSTTMCVSRVGAILVLLSAAISLAQSQTPGTNIDVQTAATDTTEATPVEASVFGLTSLTEIQLHIEPEQWALLQPPDDVNWDMEKAFGDLVGDAIAGRNFHSRKSSRPGLAGYMGIDHQYGQGDVTIGDVTISGVGIRYKGNGTFVTAYHAGKPPFKIDFNEYVVGQKFQGLSKINLSNCISDPSYMREALSYQLFRDAGIPAPRTGWAKVFLTVPGKFEQEYQGLYSIIEQVDKRFLKRCYGSGAGLLTKPVTFAPLRYFGDDWEAYTAGYCPKTEGTPEQQQQYIGFARLVYKSKDEEFRQRVADYVDIDQFVNFVAVNALLSNLDSFLAGSQNYYAYVNPESNKIEFLPWDLDHSLGAFEMLGTIESRRNLSIHHPQVGDQQRVINRILNIKQYREAYNARLQELLDTVLTEEIMSTRIDQLGEFLRPTVALDGPEAVARFDASLSDVPLPTTYTLKEFVKGRRQSVQSQLAGESQGEILYHGMDVAGIRIWMAIGIGLLVALLLNAIAWLWAVFVGFQGSVSWGVANMLLYPIAPSIYGFYSTKKARGRRAAIMVVFSCCVLAAAVLAAVALGPRS